MLKSKKYRKNGFTLIEVMIVVAIIGVLASIALPSYLESVKKARRADATAALTIFASAMERHMTERDSYCNAATGGSDVANCGTADDSDTGSPSIINQTVPLDGGTATYNLTISNVSPSTFTVLATRTGASSGDECGDFTLTQTGSYGLVNNTYTVEQCW